ncbi:hypothetical protein BBJ28_00023020 [Nothophytophthora sp. Chile5]|nr:hypothetical protein BBJ28_00023020 [Nothophytophthora sp. Chile5]
MPEERLSFLQASRGAKAEMNWDKEERQPAALRDPHVPRFPVIYKEPTFQQVRQNMTTSDYTECAVIGGASFPLGYLIARQMDRSLGRAGMLATGILGSIGSAMLAYQHSSLRLQGFGRNDEEVARYLPSKREE